MFNCDKRRLHGYCKQPLLKGGCMELPLKYYVMFCILLYSTCPNTDALSTALYKENFEKDFTIKIYNAII